MTSRHQNFRSITAIEKLSLHVWLSSASLILISKITYKRVIIASLGVVDFKLKSIICC